jgi:phosphoglycerate kinase
MRAWSALVRKAKTIVWNGPLGRAEVAAFSHGSRVLGQAIASRSRGKAFGVVGGGDTVPVLLSTKMHDGVDHISTGGGAMLEFLVEGGKLPGILALIPGSAAKSAPKKKAATKPKTKTPVRAKPETRSKTRKR